MTCNENILLLETVECYHPENNEWTILPSMKIGRSGAGVAALNQYIFVVGGFDGRLQLADVERYDTEQQIWESVARIQVARSALSLTVLDGKLYAMGGFDGQSFTSVSEIYDPGLDRWEEGAPLTSGRSGHAAAVIYQPSCANVYMDCFGESIDKNKPKPDEDENTRNGPSTSRNGALPSTTGSTLHSFSGSRCNQCDDNQQSDASDGADSRTAHADDQLSRLNSMDCGSDISYSIQDRPNYDCNEEELLRESSKTVLSDPMTSASSDVSMALQSEVELQAESWNQEKYRWKETYSDHSDDDSGQFFDSDSNSKDSIASNSNTSDPQNRCKFKKTHHCSFSKLTRTFRQNFHDFMAGSSTPAETNSSTAAERKCKILREYYKFKLKP